MKKNVTIIKKNYFNRNKKISLFLVCIILLTGIVITSGIFIFSHNNNNDLTLIAYVYDGEKHDAPPVKDDGYVIEDVKCEKAKGAWNNEKWEITLTEISGNFSCSLRFKLLHPYHKLVIDPNGGTYDESTGKQEINSIQETYTYTLSEPTRKGYTFAGWEITGGNSSVNDKVFTMGTIDTELKAKWSINLYNIEIKDSNTCDEIKQAKYDSSVNLCVPEKDGYTFAGWDISSGTIEGNSFIVDDKDAIITAKWVINNYDYIAYHLQQGINGDYVLKDTDTFTAEYNTEVSPDVREYEGFTSPSQKTIIISTKNNIINYQYERNKYNLEINLGQNVTYSEPTSIQLFYDETKQLSVPTKTGYNFKGWDKTSGEIIDNTFKMNTSDAVLTAKWEAKKYTITFNGNDGSITQTTKEVIYDQSYGELSDALRTGYDFLGWYTEPTNGTIINSTDTVKITENQTLYAHWRLKRYTINFNANEGSVSPTSTTVNHGSTISDLPTPTRSGWNFGGWYKETSFVNKVTTSTTITSDIGNLYARWYATPTISISSSQITNNNAVAGSNGKASVTWNIKATSIDNSPYTYKVIDYYNENDKRTSSSNIANGVNYNFTQSYSPGRHLLIVQASNQYGDNFYESYFFIVTESGANSGGLSGIAMNSGQTLEIIDPGVYSSDGTPLSYISGFEINIPVISGHSSGNSDTFNLYGWNGSSWESIVNFNSNDGVCYAKLTDKATSGSWYSSASSSSYRSSGTFSFTQHKYYKIKFVYWNAHAGCVANATNSASYTVSYEFISNSSDVGNINMESQFNF